MARGLNGHRRGTKTLPGSLTGRVDFIYDLRLQPSTDAISKDGMNVTAQINVRYQLAHRAVAVLHKFTGPQYLDTVIRPEIGSQAREVISVEEVYTSRNKTQEQIHNATRKSLGANLEKLVQPGTGLWRLSSWSEVLNPSLYPAGDTRGEAEPVPGAPNFGEESVADRVPLGTAPDSRCIRPGLHRPRTGTHTAA